jgi:hypothetical protein
MRPQLVGQGSCLIWTCFTGANRSAAHHSVLGRRIGRWSSHLNESSPQEIRIPSFQIIQPQCYPMLPTSTCAPWCTALSLGRPLPWNESRFFPNRVGGAGPLGRSGDGALRDRCG